MEEGFMTTKNIGYALVGAGAAIGGTAFVPGAADVLPGGLGSGAAMLGGAATAGFGTVLAIIGGK